VNIEGTSKYRGVSMQKKTKKWVSSSSYDYLGTYDTEEEAARVFDTYTLLNYGPLARTNGLVKYDDIKHLDKESLIKKREARDLPPGICMKRNSFFVYINYKKITYRKVVPTIEEALAKLEEFKKKIEEIKEEEVNNHNEMEITRNEQGVAVIPIMNKKGDIVAHATVSSYINFLTIILNVKNLICEWHKQHGYCSSYIEGKILRMHRLIMNSPEDAIVHHKSYINFLTFILNVKNVVL
jgi:hypothetical protein